jgi:hypothetical protein
MFLGLPARRASHFLTASPPSWQIDANLDIQPDNIDSAHLCLEMSVGVEETIHPIVEY